jgi:hypothetical protein
MLLTTITICPLCNILFFLFDIQNIMSLFSS